jgi:predicted Fe-S protein YdhL (DUF1289 family)
MCGCFRNREELTQWSRMNNDQKRSVLARLPQRVRAHAAETARPSRLRDKRRAEKTAKALAQEALDAQSKRFSS